MILVYNILLWIWIFLFYVECYPLSSSTVSCGSEENCSNATTNALSPVSSILVPTVSVLFNSPTASTTHRWSNSASASELGASFLQAKVQKPNHSVAINPQPMMATNDINDTTNSGTNKNNDINVNDQAHPNEEGSPTHSGLNTIETVAISVCGVLAVAGITIGLLVWRKSTHKEDIRSSLRKINNESFAGHEYPVQIIKTPLDAFRPTSWHEETDDTLSEQYEMQRKFNKQALLQLDKYLERSYNQQTQKVMNGGPSITPASNFATIPLQLQPLPSSTELPKSIATSLSIASSHLHSESKTRSLSTSDEDEMERTREFFQVFEPDGFNLTLVEQQLFMYDLPDNNRVFGQELEEGLLRHVNLIESDSEAEDFGSPLAHYLNKLLVPPIADKGSVFVRNKIDVDVGTISDNDEASLTDISRRIISDTHHSQAYSYSQQPSPSLSYLEFFDNYNKSKEFIYNKKESPLQNIEEIHHWMSRRDYYIQRYGPPHEFGSSSKMQNDNDITASTSISESASHMAESSFTLDIDNNELKRKRANST